jgi:hypothetical protein
MTMNDDDMVDLLSGGGCGDDDDLPPDDAGDLDDDDDLIGRWPDGWPVTRHDAHEFVLDHVRDEGLDQRIKGPTFVNVLLEQGTSADEWRWRVNTSDAPDQEVGGMLVFERDGATGALVGYTIETLQGHRQVYNALLAENDPR